MAWFEESCSLLHHVDGWVLAVTVCCSDQCFAGKLVIVTSTHTTFQNFVAEQVHGNSIPLMPVATYSTSGPCALPHCKGCSGMICGTRLRVQGESDCAAIGCAGQTSLIHRGSPRSLQD